MKKIIFASLFVPLMLLVAIGIMARSDQKNAPDTRTPLEKCYDRCKDSHRRYVGHSPAQNIVKAGKVKLDACKKSCDQTGKPKNF